jgi:glycosyltransferase involved in cell wall biosynthesis
VETLELGGAEQVLVNIVNNLPEDFVSFVCCLKNSGPMAGSISRLGAPVYELHWHTGNSYRAALPLANILRKQRIDVLHAHSWSTYCEAALAGFLARTPTVVITIHGMQTPYPQSKTAILKHFVRISAERILSRTYTTICAVSQGVKDYMVKEVGLNPQKVSVVYNGIKIIDRNTPDEKEPRQAVQEEDFVLVWAGRLVPVKNLSGLLKALATVRGTVPNVRLDLIGDGPDRESLEHEARALGVNDRIHFAGYTPRVRDWLSRADIFVMPSHYEGFSVALLEAMAAGLPVVATEVGGNPEIVLQGKTGVLIPPNDTEALAKAIIDLHENTQLRMEMRRFAYKRVSEEFSMDKMIAKYCSIYRQADSSKTPCSS